MTLRHLTLFIAAVVLVGCKPADKTADATTTTGSTPAAATDSGTTTPPAAIADDGKTDISGTWLTEAKDAGPVFEFKADKTFTVTGPSGMKGATLDAEGTYGVEGDKMTTKFTKMQMAATADADATTKKSVDEGNKKEAEALTKANADPEQTVKVVSKDSFTTTDKKGTVSTFTRKA